MARTGARGSASSGKKGQAGTGTGRGDKRQVSGGGRFLEVSGRIVKAAATFAYKLDRGQARRVGIEAVRAVRRAGRLMLEATDGRMFLRWMGPPGARNAGPEDGVLIPPEVSGRIKARDVLRFRGARGVEIIPPDGQRGDLGILRTQAAEVLNLDGHKHNLGEETGRRYPITAGQGVLDQAAKEPRWGRLFVNPERLGVLCKALVAMGHERVRVDMPLRPGSPLRLVGRWNESGEPEEAETVALLMPLATGEHRSNVGAPDARGRTSDSHVFERQLAAAETMVEEVARVRRDCSGAAAAAARAIHAQCIEALQSQLGEKILENLEATPEELATPCAEVVGLHEIGTRKALDAAVARAVEDGLGKLYGARKAYQEACREVDRGA